VNIEYKGKKYKIMSIFSGMLEIVVDDSGIQIKDTKLEKEILKHYKNGK